MGRQLYHRHEARRHTRSIKEAIQRACKMVFTEPNITFRFKGGLWDLTGPSEHLAITVIEKTGWGQRQPICTIQIGRPKNETGMYEYAQASAAMLDWRRHAANTRLLGHLQRQCPFLPQLEISLAYNLQDHQ